MSTHTEDSNRFVAAWVVWQSSEDAAECKYDTELCQSLAAAKSVAVSKGKQANVVEWAGVRQQQHSSGLGWQTVRSWSGDWDGYWTEPEEYMV